MTQVLYIVLALAVGLGSALQVGMLSSLGRSRGPTEAAWVSLLATLLGLSLLLAVRLGRGETLNLPSPFQNVFVFAVFALVGGAALVFALRGVPAYLGVTGLFGFAYLLAAGFLGPRIGIALFASAVTAGTLIGSVALDHVGAFGVDVHRVTLFRLAGLLSLVLGVVLVRSGR